MWSIYVADIPVSSGKRVTGDLDLTLTVFAHMW